MCLCVTVSDCRHRCWRPSLLSLYPMRWCYSVASVVRKWLENDREQGSGLWLWRRTTPLLLRGDKTFSKQFPTQSCQPTRPARVCSCVHWLTALARVFDRTHKQRRSDICVVYLAVEVTKISTAFGWVVSLYTTAGMITTATTTDRNKSHCSRLDDVWRDVAVVSVVSLLLVLVYDCNGNVCVCTTGSRRTENRIG